MSQGSVIVIDDDEAVLESMVSLLSIEGYRVTGFSAAEAFLADAPEMSTDCVITDVRMPRIDGLSLIERMRDLGMNAVPVIVVSGHADVPIAVAAMQLGATTVLEKPFSPARLLDAVAQALRQAAVAHSPIVEPSPEDKAVLERYLMLTRREREVLAHLLSGSSSKVTAIALGISPRTVDVFRANILRKMDASNIAAVATLTARAGVRHG